MRRLIFTFVILMQQVQISSRQTPYAISWLLNPSSMPIVLIFIVAVCIEYNYDGIFLLINHEYRDTLANPCVYIIVNKV